jgi:hypothetical protein
MKVKITKETTVLGKVVKVGEVVEVDLRNFQILHSQNQAVELKEEPKPVEPKTEPQEPEVETEPESEGKPGKKKGKTS